jgi:TonB family protein
VVLLPVSCFTGLTEMQIEAVLCHELAHVLRHDYLVSVAQSVVEALLFYHPAVWWVSRQIRRERECCCDDLAVRVTEAVGGDALAYARALSTLEARRGSYPQVLLGADGGVLTMRIKRLLGCRESSVAAQGAAAVVLAVLVVSAVAIGSSASAQAKADAQVTGTVVTSVTVNPTVQVAPAVVTAVSVGPVWAKPSVVAKLHVMPAPVVQPQVQVADAMPSAAAVPQEAGPVRVAGGIVAGQILSKVAPVYPAEAKAAQVQGAVVMKAVISKTGEVRELQVISGPSELMNSALDAVRQWKYKPYLLNGEPVEVATTITVNYHLAGVPDAPAQNEGPDAAGLVARPIGPGITPPVVVSAPEPEYSAEARAKKLAGRVVVHLWVDREGNPIHVQVMRGMGNELDERALAAVKQYRSMGARWWWR